MKYIAFDFLVSIKEFKVDPHNIHIFRDLQSEPIRVKRLRMCEIACGRKSTCMAQTKILTDSTRK